jgi:hypothetical protein
VGGTIIWQLCDNRFTQLDTTSSYTAYALGADGRLLYVEAAAPANASLTPAHITLWLADTASPARRTALLTLPLFLDGNRVGWLSDIAWTGPNTFIGLAQDFSVAGEPLGCPFTRDSVFAEGGAVVAGTIGPGGATIAMITGTLGATGYSLAQDGASIVFTLRDDLRLFKVPRPGGTATPVATVTTTTGNRLLGVSCRESVCVVAVNPVTLNVLPLVPGSCPGLRTGPRELRRVSLADGTTQVILTAGAIIATPQVSPLSGDVVAQVGGSAGHLQTFRSPGGGDLHLYPGLVP